MPSSIGKGGVSARFRMESAVAWTSISPVGSSRLTLDPSRSTTVPVTSRTNSLRSSLALSSSSATGTNRASNTTWAIPERSRRSMNTSSPWSRRRFTHPWRRMVCPTSVLRSLPAGVRAREDMVAILQTRAESGRGAEPRERLLRAPREILDVHDSLFALFLPEKNRQGGPRFLRHLEAVPRPLRSRDEVDENSVLPERLGDRHGFTDIGALQRNHGDTPRPFDRLLAKFLRKNVDQAVLPYGEAYSRRSRAPEVADELVVAPAAEDCVLRSEAGGRHLEDRACVVIEAAHQKRIFFERDLAGDQKRFELVVVRVRGRVERRQQVDHPREVPRRNEVLDRGILRVEDAQRVFGEAPPVVVAKGLLIRRKKRPNGLDVRGARGFGAYGVERYRQAREPEPPEKVEEHDEQLGVRRGVRGAEHLRADLAELAVAALLRALVSELLPDVVQLPGPPGLRERVLDVRARHPRRVLGAQRQGAAATVGEVVHLLVDDVRRLPHAAHEELRGLQGRRPDLVETVEREDLARGRLDAVPHARLGREEVARPLDARDHGGLARRYSALYSDRKSTR